MINSILKRIRRDKAIVSLEMIFGSDFRENCKANQQMSRPDIDHLGKAYTDQLGLGKNFFYNLKSNNPKCFDYINNKAPGDIVKAYRIFMQEKTEVTEKACQIYIELEDKYMTNDFGRFLVYKGVYANIKTYFYTHRMIFKPEPIKTFKSFLLVKQSNSCYDQFMALQRTTQ